MRGHLGERGVTLVLGLMLLPLIVAVALALWVLQGRPILYRAERMRGPGQAFDLWKFRSMRPELGDSGVTGPRKTARITPAGRVLRRTRLDELPQIWNVIRGDIGFVGPRPPLRSHVQQCPHMFNVMRDARPGLTGLASILYHRHEERLLSRSRSAAETEAIYLRNCLPRKARIDRIWAQHRSLWFDLWIAMVTVCPALRPSLRPARLWVRIGLGHGSLRDVRRPARARSADDAAVHRPIGALTGDR